MFKRCDARRFSPRHLPSPPPRRCRPTDVTQQRRPRSTASLDRRDDGALRVRDDDDATARTLPIANPWRRRRLRADASGLSPNTTYHFRIVSNAGDGQDLTFRTAPNPTPPGVTDQRASERDDRRRAPSRPRSIPTARRRPTTSSTGAAPATATAATPVDDAGGRDPVAVDGRPQPACARTRATTGGSTRRTRRASRAGRDRTLPHRPRSPPRSRCSARARPSRTAAASMLGGRVSGAGVHGMTLALAAAARSRSTAASPRSARPRGRATAATCSASTTCAAPTRYRVVSRDAWTPLTSAGRARALRSRGPTIARAAC